MTTTETMSPGPEAPVLLRPIEYGTTEPVIERPKAEPKPKVEAVTYIEPIDTDLNAEPNGKDATPITRFGLLTIVVVSTKGASSKSNWNSVRLPKDAQILDIVEVYCAADSTGTVLVFPNKDEAIGARDKGSEADTKHVAVSVGADKGVAFRKVAMARWVVKP